MGAVHLEHVGDEGRFGRQVRQGLQCPAHLEEAPRRHDARHDAELRRHLRHGYLDLKQDGPIVIDAPPGLQGIFDDFFQRAGEAHAGSQCLL